jgi:prepilin-type N-terminal cleavage/methylation domain-containing protein
MVTRPGFSIIEVIVALTLLSIGLLGIAAGGLLSARILQQAELRNYALERASSIADSLVANRIQGSGTIHARHLELRWVATAASAEVRVDIAGEPFRLSVAP